ncbi:MAG: hypothetical protein M1829_006839 [Trizodia sp. TS-e1964]|nr:MAG: hypothetical protein M1829_006839 [Trizodia sp. TS-e1964]
MNGLPTISREPLPTVDTSAAAEITQALEVIYDGRSSNEARQQASMLLDRAKSAPNAPQIGFSLAIDPSQPTVVRHFALSLLEHAIRHNWLGYSDEQTEALRGWVLDLASAVNDADPLYVRNKTAQLWVSIAKRSWAADWINMDELLVRLWGGPLVNKEFVLFILEALSEDIFNREDTIAALREKYLSKACVEIFTPNKVLTENFPARETITEVRYGQEGWLTRLGDFFSWCMENGIQSNELVRSCAIKALDTLKSVILWAIPKALIEAHSVEHICKGLAAPNVAVQIASIEALHTLYGRSHFQDDEFISLVGPMYQANAVNLLKKIYEWSIVDPYNIDEEKYNLSKKFSEMISNLGTLMEQKPESIPADSDLPGFLSLSLGIARNDSMMVSLPVINTWNKLLRSNAIGDSEAFTPIIGDLLKLCSERLLRYESLPQDIKNPPLVFLMEDFDTQPERHAFIGNYRRFCSQIIEVIVMKNPFEGMFSILRSIDEGMKAMPQEARPFSIENYTKNQITYLTVDAHFSVVESGLRGYIKWIAAHGSSPKSDELQRTTMEGNLVSWCEHLLAMTFQDPLTNKRILQLAVIFSTTALDKNAPLMLKVLEHILMIRPVDNPAYPIYSDAVKDLQQDCNIELQRFAIKMPDHLINIYPQLEAKIGQIVSGETLEDRHRLQLESFLFTVNHRSTTIDSQLREARLQSFLVPIRRAWQNPELERSLSSFRGFCESIGVLKGQKYLINRRVLGIEDWGTYQLDQEGQAIQAEMNEKFSYLPLRPTKIYLGQTVDKLVKDSVPYHMACSLWGDMIPLILPNLLHFLRYAHAFHNPSNWIGLPDEMRTIVSRVLTDRFWQSGISTGTKDDFYARVTGTKSTIEGFASSLRSAIRTARETSYSILYCMSRLGDHFYGIQGLPGPLAEALFADAEWLSSHQMSTLLNMLRIMIDDCPPPLRANFLPPILATLLFQLDNKISAEWEALTRMQSITTDTDTLEDEMRGESILRQLTYNAVLMVASLIDPQRDAQIHPQKSRVLADKSQSIRTFLLNESSTLKPLILFLTHALRMRDSRCCGITIRILRSIVPEFAEKAPSELITNIIAFITDSMVKACIESINDPYFVDNQRDLAQLIATIWILYGLEVRNGPDPVAAVLTSLPGVSQTKVQIAGSAILKASGKHQRALILDLLEGVRGVSVAEQGKITSIAARPSKATVALMSSLMEMDTRRQRGPSPDLSELGNIFA